MHVNAIVRLTENLPLTAKAFSFADLEGNYFIYLNGKLSMKARREALAHEVQHVSRDDFYAGVSAVKIEKNF